MSTPLVSIIIPVYNSEPYLRETIQSALDQTWEPKEIIIVNDGSTDNSFEIAKSFESKQVKVFTQENRGASAARNKGLREAKGDYIQFLDGDDLLMPNKVALQVNQLAGKENMLSRCPAVYFNENTNNLDDLAISPAQLDCFKDSFDPFLFLLELYDPTNKFQNIVPIHCWLTPASLIKNTKWDESLTVNDDGEYFCRVVLLSKGILTEVNTLCLYRKYIKRDIPSLSGRLDEKSLDSQYRSLMLKRDHLTAFKKEITIDKIVAMNLVILLMRAYPEHKTLANIISDTIERLGGTIYDPVLGGRLIEEIKNKFGWKTARLCQFYYHKIVSIFAA